MECPPTYSIPLTKENRVERIQPIKKFRFMLFSLMIFAGREKRISESTRKEQSEMWLLFSCGRLARCVGSVPLRGSSCLASPVATGEVASMRADGGACALRALLSLWMVYSLRSWRPLRHTACATSPALAGEAGGTLRPLAGFWFLNEQERYVTLMRKRFPSPCGVLVLKCDNDLCLCTESALVSVPLRGSGS